MTDLRQRLLEAAEGSEPPLRTDLSRLLGRARAERRRRRALPALALVACIAVGVPFATARLGPDAGPRPAAPAEQTSVALAPAPLRFVTRAGEAAAAVRSAGLPTPPGKNVLLSGWTAGVGFDTAAQKEAWNAGKVSVAPGVPADVLGAAAMNLAHGVSRVVDVIGPRSALERALEGSGGDCSGSPPAECSLTLTSATLTKAEVSTSSGPATVPVWSFRAEGLSHPIEVVAVAPGVLVPWTPPTSPPGLRQAGVGLNAAGPLMAVDGATITIWVGHGACDGALQAQVVEYDDLVVVGGTHTPPSAGSFCTSNQLSTLSTLTLAKPLGDRVVMDVVTGQPRFVGIDGSG